MHNKGRFPNALFSTNLRPNSAALAIMVLLLFLIFVFLFLTLTAQPAQGQTFQVIHTFTGGADGLNPWSGLTIEVTGGLYGTTSGGGDDGGGTVFKLSHKGSTWILTTLYSFSHRGGGNDGVIPTGRVAIARDGTLYGTTQEGGYWSCRGGGCGTVFKLTPTPEAPAAAVGGWTETVLYRFSAAGDGAYPEDDLTLDRSGNIYGTAISGGPGNNGVVYELTPSGGGWTETVIYSPQYDDLELGVSGGVIFDSSGNLYGISGGGAYGRGTVYQLSPSGSTWTTQTLYSFTSGGDGEDPSGGLIMDPSGNLYGTTWTSGTIFELSPSDGSWVFNTLYSFSGWAGLEERLSRDAAGNLYGTTHGGGAYQRGSVFKLTPSQGAWTYTSLHDFSGDDGAQPISNVVFDSSGNLYGTASSGGLYGYGVVWEITP